MDYDRQTYGGLDTDDPALLAERFAWDSYRRFVQMYGDVVLDLKPKEKTDIDPFEKILHAQKEKAGVKHD